MAGRHVTPQPRVHLAHPDKRTVPSGDMWSWCGYLLPPALLVEEPSAATCQRCHAQLNRDADATAVPSYIRTRSYSRAMTWLRERHREEFDSLLPLALADVQAEESARSAARAAHRCSPPTP